MRKYLYIALAVVIVVCGTAASLLAVGWQRLNEPLQIAPQGQFFDLPSGTAMVTLARRLVDEGHFGSARLIEWYARLTGYATRLQAGEYFLEPGLTAVGLLDKLSAGDVHLHPFTIIEGWRFRDLLTELRQHEAVVAGDHAAAEIMAILGAEDVHPEGQFLPDTYAFPRGTADIDVLRIAHEALKDELERAWINRGAELSLESSYDALILASIVEKETALSSERPRIAGVLLSRLERRMRLQADPTVIYGLGDDFDGDLRRRDLDSDTPYNTYTRRGLPPTPIALPGAASIRATTQPEMNGELYFVATGNPDGSHRFSRTLEEHNQAVRDYLDSQRRAGE